VADVAVRLDLAGRLAGQIEHARIEREDRFETGQPSREDGMPQTAGKGRPCEWKENDRRGTQAYPCHVQLVRTSRGMYNAKLLSERNDFWLGWQHSRAANSKVHTANVACN
jgi:hypothetical protein